MKLHFKCNPFQNFALYLFLMLFESAIVFPDTFLTARTHMQIGAGLVLEPALAPPSPWYM